MLEAKFENQVNGGETAPCDISDRASLEAATPPIQARVKREYASRQEIWPS